MLQVVKRKKNGDASEISQTTEVMEDYEPCQNATFQRKKPRSATIVQTEDKCDQHECEDDKVSHDVNQPLTDQASAEVETLTKWKASIMKEQVGKKRSELEDTCYNPHLEPDLRILEKLGALIYSGLLDPCDHLASIEAQIHEAKDEDPSLKEIVDGIDRLFSTCCEEKWLDGYNQDKNLYSAGTGPYMYLKCVEQARMTANKIPALIESLINKTLTWEYEKKKLFVCGGVRLVSILEDYKLARQPKEGEKNPYMEQGCIELKNYIESNPFIGRAPPEVGGRTIDTIRNQAPSRPSITFGNVDDIEIESVKVKLQNSTWVALEYKGVSTIKVRCQKLKVCKFDHKSTDYLGRNEPTLEVKAPESLSNLLGALDQAAEHLLNCQNVITDWLPVLDKGHPLAPNSPPTVTLYLSTDKNAHYTILHMDNKIYSLLEVQEVGKLLKRGTHVDACLSIDTFNYRGTGGIELNAEEIEVLPEIECFMPSAFDDEHKKDERRKREEDEKQEREKEEALFLSKGKQAGKMKAVDEKKKHPPSQPSGERLAFPYKLEEDKRTKREEEEKEERKKQQLRTTLTYKQS